ncbi:hypothetical protein FH972_011023 [Carpinus fangiana]|uniref:Protein TRIGALACTOSYLDIACYLGLYCEROL 4, chloroplastic n=1 Tax=Carpinus fangiana TaxID=176857 RepID=A0A660KQ24_9ROSI|nr:hypothetical protein FH972_011023 [Carpinus fangiana]
MANLRTAMDSTFWDLNVSSPQTLEGAARTVPGEPFPLDGARASRALRIQQLSLLGNGFPLGIIPSYGPAAHKELGSFSLQTLLLKHATSRWWLGLIGQFRPKKLISSLKAEFSDIEDLEFPGFKDVAKHFIDKSLYSFGLCSQLSLTPSSSILLSTEGHGEKNGRRHKMMLFQKLPLHDLTLEAAWPELFIDHKGRYWDVPESISLDLSSLLSESGLRYRVGLHKNSGHPKALNATDDEAPLSLMPGLCAKAAFSYEKSRDFWREKEKEEDVIVETDKGSFWRPSYDVRLKEPHSAISGIIGGACAAWFGGRESSVVAASRGDDDISMNAKKRSPLSADLFGSVCYTFQHGNFRMLYGDLTRVDARLDICSASAFATRVLNGLKRSSVASVENPASSPRLNLIFQQQVYGPIVYRVDSRVLLDYSSGRRGPHVEDFICSLSYSLRLLDSGKIVAWYSPKRKEGMIELRLFEF